MRTSDKLAISTGSASKHVCYRSLTGREDDAPAIQTRFQSYVKNVCRIHTSIGMFTVRRTMQDTDVRAVRLLREEKLGKCLQERISGSSKDRASP